MKALREFLSEQMVTEAREVRYQVELSNAKDKEGLPISATIIIDKEDQAEFEEYMEKEGVGDAFSHCEGGNLEL